MGILNLRIVTKTKKEIKFWVRCYKGKKKELEKVNKLEEFYALWKYYLKAWQI